MQIPKQQILSMIESRMGAGQAQAAANELPDQVDHEQHADLLSKFGIDPKESLSGGGNQASTYGVRHPGRYGVFQTAGMRAR